jgi:cell wall-associated NlpC family hydrolase
MIDERRHAVLEEAETWLGTPFCNQASIKGIGVGCGSLLAAVYRNAGILDIPNVTSFGHFPLGWSLHTKEERYLHIIEQYMKEMEAPQPGDTALFRIKGVFGHSGIVVEWPKVIHVSWRRSVEYSDATLPPLNGYPPKFFSPFK